MTARKSHVWLSIVAGLGLLSVHGSAQGPPDSSPSFIPNQVLVQFRPGATPAARSDARGRVGGVTEEVVVAANRRDDGRGDLELMRVPPGLAVANAVRGLVADAAVEFA